MQSSHSRCHFRYMILHTTGMYPDINGNYTQVKRNAKYFKIGTPGYSYPLFKTHKLTEQMITITPSPEIPVRLVHAVSSITTSRCTAMLEAILKPISVSYCGEEYTRDSTHYLESLTSWKEEAASNAIVSNHQNKNIHLIAADVQSLYPSCNRELVKKALQEALSSSTYSTAIQRIIMEKFLLVSVSCIMFYH